MITAYALAAGLHTLLAQPIFDDMNEQMTAYYEQGVGQAAAVAPQAHDARLDQNVTLQFDNTPVRDVLKRLGSLGVNFVVQDSSFGDARLTLNLQGVPLRDAIDAIGDALGSSWSRRGSVYVLGGHAARTFAFAPGAPSAPAVPGVPGMRGVPGVRGVPPVPSTPGVPHWNEKEQRKFEQTMEKFAEEMAQRHGKDGQGAIVWDGKDGHAFELHMKEFGQNMGQWAKQMEKLHGKDFKVAEGHEWTEKDRKAFEQHMEKQGKELGKIKIEGLGPGEHPKVFMHDMPDMKELEGMLGELSKELPLIIERAKGEHELKGHKLSDKDRAEIKREVEKARVEMRKAIEESVRERNHALGEKSKVEFLPDVPEVPAPPMVLSDTAIRGLLKSLSAEQKAIQNKRGYLKLGELTAAQRKMLGNTSRGGDWNITFVVEGQKLSIRSN